MKKKYILLVGFLMMGLVGAISLGQIVTQTQLDNLDLSTVDLECQRDGTTLELDGEWKIKAYYHCFRLIENGDDYEVIEDYTYAEYSAVSFIQCVSENNKSYCLQNELIPDMRNQVRGHKEDIREEAIEWQTHNTGLDLDNDIDLGDI